MLRYFDPCQLVVSRSATLLAFIFPHLRGKGWTEFEYESYFMLFKIAESKALLSLPVVTCYGPNNRYLEQGKVLITA